MSDPVPSVRAVRADVPECVDTVIARAMAKRPQDRFGSMDALAAALESCLGEVDGARPRDQDEDDGRSSPRLGGSLPQQPPRCSPVRLGKP